MSCLNPMLMQVIDTSDMNLTLKDRYKSKGWRFNEDTKRAYHLVSKTSRSQDLEHIDEYQNMSVLEVPCGGCVQCRLDYAQQWAIRCSHEASLYKHNYFLTLTYDDDHLTRGKFKNATLVKEDFQNFMKALREKFREKYGFVGIRFFGCGEYGDLNLRPHYHIILFNCPIPDLTIDFKDQDGSIVHKNNSLGLPMFYSDLIASCWDKGFIAIDDANFNTQSYVSRYIMKKQKGENGHVYKDNLGVIPPFLLMSNRPGIGFKYYDLHKDEYVENPKVIIPKPKGEPILSSIPRYYKKKLFAYKPETRMIFEDSSRVSTLARRSIIKGNQTTINEQRYIKEKKSESISKTFVRDI